LVSHPEKNTQWRSPLLLRRHTCSHENQNENQNKNQTENQNENQNEKRKTKTKTKTKTNSKTKTKEIHEASIQLQAVWCAEEGAHVSSLARIRFVRSDLTPIFSDLARTIPCRAFIPAYRVCYPNTTRSIVYDE
jgi:flagellar biosynthesis component FlhA